MAQQKKVVPLGAGMYVPPGTVAAAGRKVKETFPRAAETLSNAAGIASELPGALAQDPLVNRALNPFGDIPRAVAQNMVDNPFGLKTLAQFINSEDPTAAPLVPESEWPGPSAPASVEGPRADDKQRGIAVKAGEGTQVGATPVSGNGLGPDPADVKGGASSTAQPDRGPSLKERFGYSRGKDTASTDDSAALRGLIGRQGGGLDTIEHSAGYLPSRAESAAEDRYVQHQVENAEDADKRRQAEEARSLQVAALERQAQVEAQKAAVADEFRQKYGVEPTDKNVQWLGEAEQAAEAEQQHRAELQAIFSEFQRTQDRELRDLKIKDLQLRNAFRSGSGVGGAFNPQRDNALGQFIGQPQQ